MKQTIGILGGTFDPVHFGHCRAALEIKEKLNLSEVRLLPCYQPAHRGVPVATAEQRLEMLAAAIHHQPGLTIDRREIDRSGPSYMIDTLSSLRDELGQEQSLCLILGLDAFSQIHTWHQWEKLLTLCHFIVMTRPQYSLPSQEAISELIRQHETKAPKTIHESPAGKILFCPITQLDISAQQIRVMIQQGHSPRYLLPDSVWAMIQQKKLYL